MYCERGSAEVRIGSGERLGLSRTSNRIPGKHNAKSPESHRLHTDAGGEISGKQQSFTANATGLHNIIIIFWIFHDEN